jgi:hypothetical protein
VVDVKATDHGWIAHREGIYHLQTNRAHSTAAVQFYSTPAPPGLLGPIASRALSVALSNVASTMCIRSGQNFCAYRFAT